MLLLGLKEFLNDLTMHGMSNMTVDTNIFDKEWRITDKARIYILVVGRVIN